jgi:ATP-dependent Lon protease
VRQQEDNQVVAQKTGRTRPPKTTSTIGTVANLRVLKCLRITVILQGKNVLKLSVTSEDPYLTASIKDFPENRPEQTDTEFLQFLNL